MNAFQEEWNRLVEEVSKLHEQPFLLPETYLREKLIPAVVYTAISLFVLFFTSLYYFNRAVRESTDPNKKYKACYQFTNFFFNGVVGGVGLYLEYWILPTLPAYHSTSIAKIDGLENELYLPAALQLGYQFFAIPVGIFYKTESLTMLLHHVAVIGSAGLSGCMSIGFRYYTPFFLGIFEISSLPLAIMNAFKDNPELVKKYPLQNTIVRVLFCLAFLWIRWWMDFSRVPIFLRDNFLVFYTREMGLPKLYLLFQFSSAAFLTVLQIYWGILIIKGLIKQFIKPKKDATKKD